MIAWIESSVARQVSMKERSQNLRVAPSSISKLGDLPRHNGFSDVEVAVSVGVCLRYLNIHTCVLETPPKGLRAHLTARPKM